MNPDEFRIPAYRNANEAYIVVEFTREGLEKLVTLYPERDGFTGDVRLAMMLLDGQISRDEAERRLREETGL